jgi:hypothetical protein
LLEIELFHFRDTHTNCFKKKKALKLAFNASELKLILEVYETFTYTSREGRAPSVARSCDTQAISILYLQTVYDELLFGKSVNFGLNLFKCGLCWMIMDLNQIKRTHTPKLNQVSV